MRLHVEHRTLRFSSPLRTAFAEIPQRELLQVTILGPDGVPGYGEAAPLEPYDGVPLGRVTAALETYEEVLGGADSLAREEILELCRGACDLPAALAAIDLALWDREGRRCGAPLSRLLADHPASRVAVNQAIPALAAGPAAERAAQAAAGGFGCLKVKVGFGDDVARLAAVREAAGPELALRLDANGAWGVDEAVRNIGGLAHLDLELVEEPTHGLDAIRAVRARSGARVAIDETAAEEGALSAGAADAVCLKISRCGGISGLLAGAELVRASGAQVYLASSYDGPLGIAAATHAAAALAAEGPLAYCGLATLADFADIEDAIPVSEGAITVPDGPGLGVQPL